MDVGFIRIVDINIIRELCIGCGLCMYVCQGYALSMEGDIVVSDSDRCILCGYCVGICPVEAIEYDGVECMLLDGMVHSCLEFPPSSSKVSPLYGSGESTIEALSIFKRVPLNTKAIFKL